MICTADILTQFVGQACRAGVCTSTCIPAQPACADLLSDWVQWMTHHIDSAHLGCRHGAAESSCEAVPAQEQLLQQLPAW